MSEGERCLCLAFDNLQSQLQLLSAFSLQSEAWQQKCLRRICEWITSAAHN